MKKCTETAHEQAAGNSAVIAAAASAAAPAEEASTAAAKPAAPAQPDLSGILAAFAFEDEIRECRPYGNGHINTTFLVTLADGRRYILQKISSLLTTDAKNLMKNIASVTDHLKRTETDPRRTMTILPTRQGDLYYPDETGNWRVYLFIEGSVCLEDMGNEDDFYKSAFAFGHFMEELKDFPAEELTETIPDFHNTPLRYRKFHKAVEEDPAGRRSGVEKEIAFLFERETEAGMLQRMRDSGELPTRVTHNDTKLNNILFDAETREPLCVIDLDTVMPGLSLYDFGDLIRYGASTAAEDEKDLSKVHLDLRKYEILRKGFTDACPGLTPKEVELLPMGAKVITVEQAVRFLTDYLEGDPYYKTHYPGQNLDRTRTQIRLVQEMEEKWEKLT